ncbi:GSCFA domain-containing protein [Flavobacteriaceae bacterium KMM 6898]|nr:GSCFA domain-containing protein [Flavobacteriaceae bacterium KMM 6898]
MKLQTHVPLEKAQNPITYDGHILSLGSCFAEHIGNKLGYYKFQSMGNPFGILFHPLAIENLLSRAIAEKEYTKADVFFLNERWHCFDGHSILSHASEETLLDRLNTGLQQTRQQIKGASHILITLGTSWVYRNNASGSVVANCHKVQQKQFTKELLSVDEVVSCLEGITRLIQANNPLAQLVFTVSPVRHLKDGFVANQRSKAHLITAIHKMLKTGSISYFPSYEIMMDELRDYRFYAEDMVHPSELAITYIWEKFKDCWVDNKAYPVMEKVGEIQRGLSHRPFDPNSDQHLAFLKALEQKMDVLKQTYPFMKF